MVVGEERFEGRGLTGAFAGEIQQEAGSYHDNAYDQAT